MKLGLSVYGLNIGVKQLNATALGIKKVIKNSGRSIRVVPNNELYLNSAQVLHNQLTSQLGWELVFVRDGQKLLSPRILPNKISKPMRGETKAVQKEMPRLVCCRQN